MPDEKIQVPAGDASESYEDGKRKGGSGTGKDLQTTDGTTGIHGKAETGNAAGAKRL
jgi:hypothetical protein